MSAHRLAAFVLVAAMLGVWAFRSFVFDAPSGEPSPAAAPVAADEPDASQRASTSLAPPADPSVVVARSTIGGVPAGYPRSGAGAATAATNWVASFPTIVRLGPIRLDDTLNQLLSQRIADAGADEVVADYFTLIDELGPDFARRVWIESPLQVDVIDADETTATVAVWALLVTGDPRSGPIDAVWRTHRIELVWERDDWRIDDVMITEGPTPVPSEVALPSPPGDFTTVDSWMPAVFADTTTDTGGE